MTVQVAPNGAFQHIEFSPAAMRLTHVQLSHLVMQTVQKAQINAAEQVASLVETEDGPSLSDAGDKLKQACREFKDGCADAGNVWKNKYEEPWSNRDRITSYRASDARTRAKAVGVHAVTREAADPHSA